MVVFGSGEQRGRWQFTFFFKTIQDCLGSFDGRLLIPDVFGINDHHRTAVANVHAAGAGDHDIIQAAVLRLHGEVLEDAGGFFFVADAGRAGGTITAADEYVMCWFAHILMDDRL